MSSRDSSLVETDYSARAMNAIYALPKAIAVGAVTGAAAYALGTVALSTYFCFAAVKMSTAAITGAVAGSLTGTTLTVSNEVTAKNSRTTQTFFQIMAILASAKLASLACASFGISAFPAATILLTGAVGFAGVIAVGTAAFFVLKGLDLIKHEFKYHFAI